MTLSEETDDFLRRRKKNGKQKEFFDSHADVWDEINHHDAAKIGYIADLLQLAGNESVLDVGTGTGVMLPYYLERLP
jgi:demethylmenaquinone methyltransferase/2-methoxy-6-polyprenyl-1,4-benzoquinol methylase